MQVEKDGIMGLKNSTLFKAGVFLTAAFGCTGKQSQTRQIADCVQHVLENSTAGSGAQVYQSAAPDAISVTAYSPLRNGSARTTDIFSIAPTGAATFRTTSNDRPGDPSSAVGTITYFNAEGARLTTKPIDTPEAQQGIWSDRQSEEHARATKLLAGIRTCLPDLSL
jgi:hypothetical protein